MTTLGKGANCALLDAVSLAETITPPVSPPSTSQGENIQLTSEGIYKSRRKLVGTVALRPGLRAFAVENVKRRHRERQRSAFLQNLVYFGDNKFKEYCRERVLKNALGWVEGTKGRKKEHYGARGETRDVGGLLSPNVIPQHISDGKLDRADEESIIERQSFIERGWGLVRADELDSECVSVASTSTRESKSTKASSSEVNSSECLTQNNA